MNRTKRWLSSLAVLVALLAAAPPQAALAQELDVETDARVEGITGGDVKVKNDSTALAWLFMVVLAVLAISPLLKDAKRTHLD